LFFSGGQLPAAVDVRRSHVWGDRSAAPSLEIRTPIPRVQARLWPGGHGMLRLRGGAKGGIKFMGADGETINVRDDGRISKADKVGTASYIPLTLHSRERENEGEGERGEADGERGKNG
jgi:hypothetical protein